ncbi:MAG: hypothetical protein ACRCVA_10855 [Phreatobacter sp.]
MRLKGWFIPADLPDPLDVAAFRDDVHVIATLDGHPRFEAVEAMIRQSGSGSAIVRAIVTLHDQSQIDHTNDANIHAATAAGGRRVVMTDVATSVTCDGGQVRAQLSFEAYTGERIALRFVGLGLASPERGGLTDPGGHAMGSCLPIMWRDRSTIGTEGTQVQVGTELYDVPLVQRIGPGRSLRKAFFAEGHRMAVIRAGRRRIAGSSEAGDPVAQRKVERLVFPSVDGQADLSMEFVEGAFRCHLGQARDLVTGEAWTEAVDATITVGLTPIAPAWAIARPVVAVISRDGSGYEVTTTIG